METQLSELQLLTEATKLSPDTRPEQVKRVAPIYGTSRSTVTPPLSNHNRLKPSRSIRRIMAQAHDWLLCST